MPTGTKGQANSRSATVSEAKSQAGNTHIAGEMFVAAELAKRGYNVSLTMGNAKAVDIFAERNGFAVCVQVKALSRSKNVGWPLPIDKSKIVANVIYACVILNEINTPPSYYILRPEDVLRHGKWYDTRAILEISKLKAHGFLDQWSIIGEEVTKQAERGPAALPTAEPESLN